MGKNYEVCLEGNLSTGSPRRKNEIDPRLQGVLSMSPTTNVDSSSRKQMFGSHIGQSLVIKNGTPRFLHTGTEFDYGNYTFNISMPKNSRIFKIIERYPAKEGYKSFKYSPQKIAVYQDEDGEYGYLDLVRHLSNHSHFGFTFKNNPENMESLRPGVDFPAGTVFKDSPAKGPNGEYNIGREIWICLGSFPGTVEDSVIISDKETENLEYTTFEHRVYECGSEEFPLNMYGNDGDFKIFPEIGEYLDKDNGLLMAFRKFDVNMVPVEQSVKAMQHYMPYFDKGVYADGAGGQVVDVVVYRQRQTKNDVMCPAVTEQLERYANGLDDFNKEIIKTYDMIKKKEYPKKPRLTPMLQNLIVRAYSELDYREVPEFRSGPVPTIKHVYKMTQMDDWRIAITVKYTKIPGVTSKITDTHGSKGVISQKWPHANMPSYDDGTTAGIIMSPESQVNRMNFGRSILIHIASCSHNLVRKITKHLNIDLELDIKEQLYNCPKDALEYCFKEISDFHFILNRVTAKWYDELTFQEKLVDLSYHLKINIIPLQLPCDNQIEWLDMVENLNKQFPPREEQVTYTTPEGKRVRTKDKFIMAPTYTLLLEKTGKDYSSVSIAKTQQNGVISSLSNSDRYSTPTKLQATRFGEAEYRLLVSYGTPLMAAELHDRSNSNMSREAIVRGILDALIPSNIDNVIDRALVPYGGSKPLKIFKHMLKTNGIEIKYTKYNPSKQTPKSSDDESMEVDKETKFNGEEEN